MKQHPLFSLLILSIGIVSTGSISADSEVVGYRPDEASKMKSLEARYDTLLDADNLRSWMKHMTDRPHHAGSPKTKENAEFMANLFRSWGYDTTIETYHVLFPTPKLRELHQLKPIPVKLSLTEEVMDSDSVAEALRQEGLPPFNAYSADGDVVGTVVYVNEGLPRDYEVLEQNGIDVRGKIVLARYGGSWRGIKPKVAYENGAIGCIIFNDPSADGFAEGAAYPDGAFKHESAVQRGSVVDLPVRPGDPLTPNYGATRDAERLSVLESETVMKIPVLPISEADAAILMKTLDGRVAPSSWRGALPLTYRFGGGGGTVVRLNVAFHWDQIPAYNVIAKYRGSEFPDEWVIRGNHHDAWVIGARDPISGMVAVLEQARAFSELIKQGWKPKRTLVFCGWDAEEPGLLGSTEWAEDHAALLQEKTVAYINTDGCSRGFLSIGGAHSLERMAAQVSQDVLDPQTQVSVSDRKRSEILVNGSPELRKLIQSSKGLPLSALGSGSDYTVFLQHLGIPTFNVAFGGEGIGGEYHTSFDTFDHFNQFVDPGYEYGIALTKVCGRLTMRIADAEVVPIQFSNASKTYSGYADELVKLLDKEREAIELHNTLVNQGHIKNAADPTWSFVNPATKDEAPFLNFAPLLNGLKRLEIVSSNFQENWDKYFSGTVTLSREKTEQLNKLLYQSEQALIREEGLPRRPWFRHQVYAPGFYTGYGVKTFPGIREAIEEGKWSEAEEQVQFAANAISAYAGRVEQATALLTPE
ncbi:MAG: M28 family peptidase [Verrucomicrobia bacterium]|nr:M28 family peptidase [Verrucomicrobiota bacterium]MDA1066574.1 M28 family peptidase [Verrucomicrobiota bacterium]